MELISVEIAGFLLTVQYEADEDNFDIHAVIGLKGIDVLPFLSEEALEVIEQAVNEELEARRQALDWDDFPAGEAYD